MKKRIVVIMLLTMLTGVALLTYALSVVRFGLVNAYLVTDPSSFQSILMNSNGKYLLIIYADSQCPACNYLKSYVLSNSTVASYVQSHYVPIYVDLDYQAAVSLTNINIMINGTVYLIEPINNEVTVRVYRTNTTQVVPFSVQATPTLLVAYDNDGALIVKEIILGAYPPQILMDILSLVHTNVIGTSLQRQGTASFTNIYTLALSYAAGLGSAIMPCALPALVSIALMALNRKINPIALFGGFLVFYIALGSLLSLIGLSGVTRSTLYIVSSIILILMGLVFLIPPLYRGFITFTSRVQNMGGKVKPGGLLADLTMGLVLTGLWLPCIGPIFAGVALGSILASQLTHNILMGVLTTAAFSLGFVTMASIVFTLANLGRRNISKVASIGSLIEKTAGIAMIILGVYLLMEAL
ncbi:thioredoxin fold domain-containing protein [Caldivirga maquilingensis]|uniref:Cytochrome c biogenesis protein transmembrane region n=1 Tax=Caldivirga maquilingensis (strain ATCC 700844 / DSM 13496 / JCM 10307 / IC-167) TaxID=397948 RepID=A8MAH2_CALMQ|nr:thioredoxin fold domain-containing protein [Caldivirga maquilingensis]ABW02549.1 cytochrome c biogenesis protein transmembrane region [Caldivirga maquilingensis IC-167]